MMSNISAKLGIPAGPLALFSIAFLICRGDVTVNAVHVHELVSMIDRTLPYVA